jgi:hypothetical protein
MTALTRTHMGAFAAVAAICVLTLGGLMTPAGAASEKGRYTEGVCAEGTGNPFCGAVALVDAGVYTVTATHLHALSPQGSDYTAATGCSGAGRDYSNDLPSGSWYTFIVPANCAYKAKMNIKDGPTKDKDLFLTPGCLIQMRVTGSLFSNDFKVEKVSWTDAAKTAGKSGPVVNAAGQKCGLYSKRNP